MSVPLRAQAARTLERLRQKLVEETVEVEFRQRPDFWSRWGPIGKTRCLEDTNFHVNFLICALVMDSPVIFTDYVDWLVALLAGYGMGVDDVRENLGCLTTAISAALPPDESEAARSVIGAALARLGGGSRS